MTSPVLKATQWALITPVDWTIAALDTAKSLLGCFRFFLVVGGRLGYLRERRRWFEERMLGRRMTMSDLLAFGAWHAETARRQRAIRRR
ncbi:MAG: hypothetical protein HY683_10745 [Chloroflexi bacterium]|nr:hypothetical protein [Chloroflexota bacterium]